MKTIEEVFSDAYAAYEYYEDDGQRYIQILREWAEEIINQCAESAEVIDEGMYHADGSSGEYYVVDKESILKVKQQIQ